MSGPTRQRSFRERLHGIGIPWQGKKSKSYHNKDDQTLAEDATKAAVQDSQSSEPVPSCEEDSGQKKDESKSTPRQSLSDEPEKTDDKCHELKEVSHFEKRLLNRSFTQPKGTEEYRVKVADTLERIAAIYDTTPSELAKLNRLTARVIFPGQMLFVPEKRFLSGVDTTSTVESSSDDATSNEAGSNGNGQACVQDNSKLGTAGGDAPSRRKVSVTDALRIPYRRHSDRLQRFMKVKARHFTDGQGVVSGVLIITPNAVMFDPNVSDPLVIEHGIESYGVIAPLDMVMRTAIYFDIAHMKVKNAPETQLNIPKPDIYFGKMVALGVEEEQEEEKGNAQKSNPQDEEAQSNNEPSNQETITQEKEELEAPKPPDKMPPETEEILQSTEPKEEAKEPDEPPSASPESTDVAEDEARKPKSETDKDGLSRNGSLDKEVSDAFANGAKKTLSGENSIESPTPPLPQPSEDAKQAPESRRERMLKRLSYPMESITSYTQSSISRILSSSPKSFVDFSSGLFVRSSEEDKGKDGAQIAVVAEEVEKEDAKDDESEEQEPAPPMEDEGTPQKQKSVEEPISEKEITESATVPQSEEPTSVGYKNFVDERPGFFAVLDRLLKQNAAQEQEGPPLYLCLRMGYLKEKKLQPSTPILSYGKKKAKSEYWFSIPHNRVEDLYNFLQQWFPHLYGDVEDIDPDKLGFIPIDDSVEDEEEEVEEKQKEEDDKEKTDGEAQKSSTPRSFLKLVEDHFGFRSISPTDWEVLNLSESEKFSFEECELPVPELQSPSDILQDEHIKELHNVLPGRAMCYEWTLIFSTSLHGFNLKTLYRKSNEFDSPVLLVIQDTEDSVFGSLISMPFKPSDHFYGNGESFLYTFCPEFKVFKWTGENTYFAKGDNESVAMGAGDGQFGLWIDGDLNRGRSQRCLTFNNDVLCKNEDFVVKSLEVWGFV